MRALTLSELAYVRGGTPTQDGTIADPFGDPFYDPWGGIDFNLWDDLREWFRDVFGNNDKKDDGEIAALAINACYRAGKAADVTITRGNISTGISLPVGGSIVPLNLGGNYTSINVDCQ